MSTRLLVGPLDLRHQGVERAIGVYVMQTHDGLALFDCGPSATLPHLDHALAERSIAWTDVRHVVLSHVHLDHAGAAGTLAERHPQLTIWVSEHGAPHLVDPSRLEASARRVFGAAHDALWGPISPVPRDRLRSATEASALGLDVFATPGHASHHVTYVDSDGVAYDGDLTGVRLPGETFVRPSTPPPDIDLALWNASLEEVERHGVQRLALVHFGLHDDVGAHLARQRAQLELYDERVRHGVGEEEFAALAASDLEHAAVPEGATYELVADAAHNYAGLRRYRDRLASAPMPAR